MEERVIEAKGIVAEPQPLDRALNNALAEQIRARWGSGPCRRTTGQYTRPVRESDGCGTGRPPDGGVKNAGASVGGGRTVQLFR